MLVVYVYYKQYIYYKYYTYTTYIYMYIINTKHHYKILYTHMIK